MAPRLRRAKGADYITSGSPMSEGRFDLSTFRSERTNEASTLTITPKRSSSRDVGTSSYRYHTATRRQIYRPISKRNRRITAQQVANQFLAASGKHISRKTVARRLRGGGLYARRPVVCVPLTRQHRTARFQWCREHHNWTEHDWVCVLFSDESRFSLSSDCRRQLIWRESGTAYRPENSQEKDRYTTCSIMVWAGIMINGRTRLHEVANGTMTVQRYIDEVLLPHVRLFRGAVGDKFVFMDDNASHRTLAVQDCLDSEGIQRLVWPARSPDLNPIENVWDALGRQVAGRNYPPTNKNTLIRALTEEWDKLPQQLLDNVVQSSIEQTVSREGCSAPEVIVNGSFIPDGNTDFSTVQEIHFVGLIGRRGQKRECKIKCLNGVWVGPMCTEGKFQLCIICNPLYPGWALSRSRSTSGSPRHFVMTAFTKT
ncbi:transposable element Tcb2 transposase [Trichonephila clavipes]|uniref:Transposable element Tcb2 transposase n=1 Tax=Trichonephila clavipes TaxID=2585209 RepID=A0A8X6RRI8_TRICX|nr:transposable element Tcb2 transposase [Trichonephila clavipes]